ncbi:hypothetical protein [Nonomuraea jabiensis]|uniref:Cytochrome bc1 complex cytochrome b subunit n=1 Tax=Nonomuraea jabiensis TaxID=882448 RepID=A0A7W9G3V7_9ACTN|nr:hypothetical protein [Nonomuraea jabiensis]MBB5776760.1 hypothetical protein [Nonomuraea jabiensis]
MSVLLVGCLGIVLVTGAFLAFFYSHTDNSIIYDGPYEPLRGVEMSTAYASELELAFEAPGGLLVRALHQWAGLAFLVVAVFRLLPIRRIPQVLPVLALLGLGALNVVVGLVATGAVPAWEPFEQVPTIWWYSVHLLLALMTAAALIVAWRQQSRPD